MANKLIKTIDRWKESYFDYLTKRLDSGESKNIAVLETIKVLKKKLVQQNIVKILDIGCFSGAMLNRILNSLSKDERSRVKAVGLDLDREVVSRGADKYQDIVFVYGHIEKTLPLIGQFDIILLSNILHEIAPSSKLSERKKRIREVFRDITNLLAKNGNVIILDGCKPTFNKTITISFSDDRDKSLYVEFSKKYQALKIKCVEVGNKIETDQISLTAFLTKSRYMKEDYWENESLQLYQYFSEKEFIDMFEKNNLKLKTSAPQYFSQDQLDSLFKSIKPKIKTPAKNILLIAEK